MMVATDLVRAALADAHPVNGSPTAGRVSDTAWGRVAIRYGAAANQNIRAAARVVNKAAVQATLIVCVLGMWVAAVVLPEVCR